MTKIDFPHSNSKLSTAHFVATVLILIDLFIHQKFCKPTISINGLDIFQFAEINLRFLHKPPSIDIYDF